MALKAVRTLTYMMTFCCVMNRPVISIPLPYGPGTYCAVIFGHSTIPSAYDGIPRALFGILLLVVAIYRFTVHSIETRRMVGKPRTNEYMKLLLEHTVIYFFLYVRLSSEDSRNTYIT